MLHYSAGIREASSVRKLLFLLPLAALFVFVDPLQAFGNTTSTMQVSFMVLDRCTVSEIGITIPFVKCSQTDDFIVEAAQPAPAKAAPGARQTLPLTAATKAG
jgi:hypothetical protein